MTQEEIAKTLITLRYENEIKLSDNIRKRLLEVFKALCALGYSGSLTPYDFQFRRLNSRYEVNRIITELVEWLMAQEKKASRRVIEAVEDAYKVKVDIDADDVYNEDTYGHTTRERARIYANRFKYEAEAWIASALMLGLSQSELANYVAMYAEKPYNNPIFNDAVKTKGFSATRLVSGGISYGVGKSVSAVGSMRRLGRAVLANSFKEAQWRAFMGINAIGFLVYRGSSYPCDICDSMVGFHPMSLDQLPPYHNNCVCYAVPVTVGF